MTPSLMVRCVASAAAVAVWAWGLRHWPRAPDSYAAGFWAWAAGLSLLWLACSVRRPGRIPLPSRAGWAATVIVAVAAAARFWDVTTAPFDIHFDEVNGLEFIEAMHAGYAENVFSSTTPLGPALLFAPEWIAGLFIPNRMDASRYIAALWGTASIGLTYLLARRTHGPAVALTATVVLACSFWHFTASRFQPLFLLATVAATAIWWTLARACDSGRIGDGILAGIVAGVGLQMYDPVKVMIGAVPLWWLWHAVVTREFARRTAIPVAAAALLTAVVMQPMLAGGGSTVYFHRTFKVTLLGEVLAPEVQKEMAPTLERIPEKFRLFARMATGGAAIAANHRIADPLVNWLELAAMLAGLAIAALHLRDWRRTIAPIWLLLTCVAVVLSSVPEASYRLAVALPALAILAADAIVGLAQWTLRCNDRAARGALAAAATAAFTWHLWTNSTHAVAYLRVMQRASEFTTLGRAIAGAPAAPIYYVEGPLRNVRHYIFRAPTSAHDVVTVPNLAAQIPDAVRPDRGAVIALPYWTSSHSLAYIASLFPQANVRQVFDPSGREAGHLVELPPDSSRSSKPLTCGLQRTGCTTQGEVLDPYIGFLEVQELCPPGGDGDGAIAWHGVIDLPDPPPTHIGLAHDAVASGEIGGVPLAAEARPSPESSAVRFAPGRQPIRIVSGPRGARHGRLWLWWTLPGESPSVVPCTALRPD